VKKVAQTPYRSVDRVFIYLP